MTKDEIIEMAVKAGNRYLFDAMQTDFLQRFAALVAEKERGLCAKEGWIAASRDCEDRVKAAILARKP